jgi:hypothetical protein
LPNFEDVIAAPIRRGQNIRRQFYDKFVAAPHNRSIRNFILRDRFQIALPLEKKAIILTHKVGIVPVGVRP